MGETGGCFPIILELGFLNFLFETAVESDGLEHRVLFGLFKYDFDF